MTGPSFSELTTRAERIKREAKSVRKEWTARASSAERDAAFDSKVKELDDVIRELKPFLRDDSGYRQEAQENLGDCLGVKGGTYRDWGRYDDARKAYDEGLEYEEAINALGRHANSYCLVQRLVARVLMDPKAFEESALIGGLDTKAAMRDANAVIRVQMAVLRKGDPWAQADLSLLQQLIADDSPSGYREAGLSWDALEDMNPRPFVFNSTLEVVRLVSQRLMPFLRETGKASWSDLIARLESAASQT